MNVWSRVVARLHQTVEHGHDDREEGRGGGGHGAGAALGGAARREAGDERVDRSLVGRVRAAVGGVALKRGCGHFAHVDGGAAGRSRDSGGGGVRGLRRDARGHVRNRLA